MLPAPTRRYCSISMMAGRPSLAAMRIKQASWAVSGAPTTALRDFLSEAPRASGGPPQCHRRHRSSGFGRPAGDSPPQPSASWPKCSVLRRRSAVNFRRCASTRSKARVTRWTVKVSAVRRGPVGVEPSAACASPSLARNEACFAFKADKRSCGISTGAEDGVACGGECPEPRPVSAGTAPAAVSDAFARVDAERVDREVDARDAMSQA